MDYNTQRKKLVLPEYGRHVLNMVEHIRTIENREERTKAARAIIYTMSTLNPQLKDSLEFKHKLWDHLYMLSEFQLDVESPFPPPLPEELQAKPQPVPYPRVRVRLPYYGYFVEQAITALSQMEETEEKRRMVLGLANQMKRNYVMYNKESVEDITILRDLERMSSGKLMLPETTRLAEMREAPAPVAHKWQKKSHRR